MDTSLVQFYYHIMLLDWIQNFDMMMLRVTKSFVKCLNILFEHLQLLCCRNFARNSNAFAL